MRPTPERQAYPQCIDAEVAWLREELAREREARVGAEHARAEAERNYRELVENQTDLIAKVDPQGRFLFVSPSYCETFGKTEAELLGQTFMPLIHAEDQETVRQAMRQVLQPPYVCYVEERALTRDGWRWLGWSNRAVLDGAGQVVAVVGIGRDITDRKRVEDLLLREQERARVTLQSIGDGVITTDAAGRLDYLNPAAEALLGAPLEEARGRTLEETLHVLDRDGRRRVVGLAMPPRPKRSGTRRELDLVLLDDGTGERRDVRVSVAPIQGVGGGLAGTVLVLRLRPPPCCPPDSLR